MLDGDVTISPLDGVAIVDEPQFDAAPAFEVPIALLVGDMLDGAQELGVDHLEQYRIGDFAGLLEKWLQPIGLSGTGVTCDEQIRYASDQAVNKVSWSQCICIDQYPAQ